MTAENSRRRFSRRVLFKTGAAAGVLGALPTFVPSHVLGRAGIPAANDRIRLGVIGLGMRGNHLPLGESRPRIEPQTALGSGRRTIHRRSGGESSR